MTAKVDGRRRVVLPRASPGEIYDVQEQGDGRYLLVRLEPPQARMTRKQCVCALEERPLRLGMTWEEIRRLTRKP